MPAYSEPNPTPGVLLVIPAPDRRAGLAAALADGGFAVWPVGSALEAFSAFLDRTGEVDLLLLDAALPDQPAAAFLRRLRAHFPGVPCVVLAAAGSGATELEEDGAVTVAPDTPPADLAARLWEAVAVEAG